MTTDNLFGTTTLADAALADQLIVRLNKLIEDPAVRKLVSDLIEKRVEVPDSIFVHPTIITSERKTLDSTKVEVGFLGLLNGMVGRIGYGPRAAWGLITADCDDDGLVTCFKRTKE